MKPITEYLSAKTVKPTLTSPVSLSAKFDVEELKDVLTNLGYENLDYIDAFDIFTDRDGIMRKMKHANKEKVYCAYQDKDDSLFVIYNQNANINSLYEIFFSDDELINILEYLYSNNEYSCMDDLKLEALNKLLNK